MDSTNTPKRRARTNAPSGNDGAGQGGLRDQIVDGWWTRQAAKEEARQRRQAGRNAGTSTAPPGGGAGEGNRPPVGCDAPTSEGTEAFGTPIAKVLIHEERSGPQGPQGLTTTLDAYAGRVGQARQFAAYLRDRGEADLGKALGTCGSMLWFHHYATAPKAPLKLAKAIMCQKPLLCAFCAARRGGRAVYAATPKVLARLRECPDLRPYLLTLTQKTGDDLDERVKHLLGAWSKWLQRKRDHAKGKAWSSLCHLDGGILCCETKRSNNDGKWHFHAHAVVLARPGLSKFQFVDEWARLLGQKTANLDLRALRSADLIDSPSGEKAIGEDLLEVFKYAVKAGDMSHADHFHAAQTLKGRKLIRPFGSLRGVDIPDDLLDDESDLKAWPFVELVFRYSGGRYHAADIMKEKRIAAFDEWNEGGQGG